MFNVTRGTLLNLAVGSVAANAFAAGKLSSGNIAYYASDGSEVIHYDVDVAMATLTKRGSIMLPSAVQ